MPGIASKFSRSRKPFEVVILDEEVRKSANYRYCHQNRQVVHVAASMMHSRMAGRRRPYQFSTIQPPGFIGLPAFPVHDVNARAYRGRQPSHIVRFLRVFWPKLPAIGGHID
jgi:hypothetical protein